MIHLIYNGSTPPMRCLWNLETEGEARGLQIASTPHRRCLSVLNIFMET